MTPSTEGSGRGSNGVFKVMAGQESMGWEWGMRSLCKRARGDTVGARSPVFLPKGIAAIRVDCPAFDPEVVRHTRHTVRGVAIIRNGICLTRLSALLAGLTDLRQAKVNRLVWNKRKIGQYLAQTDA